MGSRPEPAARRPEDAGRGIVEAEAPTARLAAVERAILEAKARITCQEVLTARLAVAGGDVVTARQVLEAMRQELAELYRHRRLILEETATASR